MAVLVISKPPGVPLSLYDPVTQKLDLEGDPPAGLISHAVVPRGESFEVYDIWESQAQHDDFVENRLKPAIAAVVGEERFAEMPDAERESSEIHHLVTP